MLEGACGKRYDELSNLNVLQNTLKNRLESKRFLLVLDDIWEDENKWQWDSIVAPLNYCRIKGSIILVTTRNQSIAKMIDARDISLHGLEKDAFLSFFSTCIFNDPNYGGNCKLRNIGQQIANKLKGNPLAAKTVSALLREKLDERYWMKIRDSEEWKSQSGTDDILPALRLSYEHMPFHLQSWTTKEAELEEATVRASLCLEGENLSTILLINSNDLPSSISDLLKETKFLRAVLPHNFSFQNFICLRYLRLVMPDLYTCNTLPREICRLYRLQVFDLKTGSLLELPNNFSDLVSLRHFIVEGDLHSKILGVELDKVFNPLGAHLLELDPGTGARYDWRFIRAKFGVCDPKLIPSVHYVERLTPSGKIKVFDISIEIENETTESVHAWRARLNGRPYPNGTEFGLLGDVDTGTDQIRVEVADASVGEGLEGTDTGNADADMEEEQSVQLEVITPGCKPGSVGGRKRDEEDGDAPGSGKKGNIGITPKRVGVSKPSGSGSKPVLKSAPKAGGSGSRPTKKPISSASEATSPIPLSPNLFQSLSADQHFPEDTLQTPAAVPKDLLPTQSIISGTMKRTWGSRKKHSPITIKRRPTIGVTARRNSKLKSDAAADASGPQLPSLNTPAVEESTPTDKRVGTRKSLRVQAQAEQLSTMSKAIKRVRDKETGSASNAEQLSSLKEIGGSLRISNLENVKSKIEASKARLAEKKNLDALYLQWNYGEQENENVLEGLKPNTNLKSDGYGGVASPTWWEPSLKHLEFLTLEGCKAWDELLPPIGELEFLKDLKLSGCAVREIGAQCYEEDQSLILDQSSSHKVGKLLAFRELSYLRVLMIFCISSLESLDLHSFVALKELFIEGCQSLTSLTFGEHLVSLKGLEIISCKTLSSMKGLTSWVNLERLHFRESPGFSAAWDSASKEIERTEPDFSLSLTTIEGDYLALLTLPICKQLSSLQILKLEFPAFTEEHQISLHVLTSWLISRVVKIFSHFLLIFSFASRN
ncbi:disease resistance protein RGA3 [Carex littledalei]|uniref:Disease resistance protein RGA3 n=1 Tax=Carex littledalei TaxID=544730 RepID=A0A833QRS7_9POAL|nr:disease resistance protein RGA3 [Carex littledalei]